MHLPGAKLINSSEELAGNYYDETQHIKVEFLKADQEIEVLSRELASLLEGNYPSFPADHFSLYEKIASPELANVLKETGFFNVLMQKGTERMYAVKGGCPNHYYYSGKSVHS